MNYNNYLMNKRINDMIFKVFKIVTDRRIMGLKVFLNKFLN